MGYFQYVSDNGTTYKMKLDDSNSTAVGASAEAGGVAGTDAWYPRGWVPRYILADNATYGRRKVVAPNPAHGTWTGSTATIALEVVGVAVAPTFNITARIGEKRTSRG